MALYNVCDRVGIIEDSFAWHDATNDEYWFNGATLSKRGWVTNSISLDKYFAITDCMGIGIREDKIVLMEANRETHAVNLPAGIKIRRYNELFVVPCLSDFTTGFLKKDPTLWSDWYEIKKALKTAQPQEDAQAILSVMEAWESTSRLTLKWVNRTLNGLVKPQDVVEIFVAGLQWLWHNCTSETVIMGYKQKIWGSVSLASDKEIITRGAIPIHNGWLVGVNRKERYLLRRARGSVRSSPFTFLYGPWTTYGAWRHWYFDQAVLTPKNQLVAIPFEFGFDLEYPNWICFEKLPDLTRLLLVSDDGRSYDLDFSEYPGCSDLYDGGHDVYPGKQHMLIHYYDSDDDDDNIKRQYFAMMDIGPEVGDSPKIRWRMMVAPDFSVRITPYPLCLEDGANEVFVFSFGQGEVVGYGVVNEQGQFGIVPWLFKDDDVYTYKYVDANGVERNDRFAVVPSKGAPNTNPYPVVIGISDGHVYTLFDPGVHISWPLLPFPEGKEGMWPYLASVLERGNTL